MDWTSCCCEGSSHSRYMATGKSVWESLGKAEKSFLKRHSVFKTFKPSEVIFSRGEACSALYCVQDGLVAIGRAKDSGASAILSLAYPGEMLELDAALADGTHKTTASSLDRSRVCAIERIAIQQLLMGNTTLAFRFLKEAAAKIDAMQDRLLVSLSLPLRARFAQLLLSMYERHSHQGQTGRRIIGLPMNRRDMAAMIGVRPESLSRLLAQFEHSGIARFCGRDVEIQDFIALIREANAIGSNKDGG